MNLVGRAPRRRLVLGRSLVFLLAAAASHALAAADTPIASSNFAGVESPLSENGAWTPIFSMSPQGTQFQKNNGAFCDRFTGPDNNHAGARTTAAIPADHYSEIVVGHIGNNSSYVGAFARIQTSGPAVDSGYMWWGSLAGGANNFLYRIDANGTSYKAIGIGPQHSPFADGDRLRLIARGPVLYGIKNGVREFIFNVGRDAISYSGGTAGMLAYVPNFDLTSAVIASWAGGAAPTSSGVWASSTFAGVEDPLDEGDRWYPLPSYSGHRKAGGFAVGKDGGHNASGVWSIAPPQKQYSEVTLGTVATGGGGPIVRIDRTNPGPTGWLLFLWADNPVESGVYKMNPDGTFVRFQQFTPTLVSGDKWRLTADGNTLTVSRNGVALFSFTTDGSYPAGDVGMETLTPAFTLMGWEGGDVNGPAPAAPTIASFTPSSGQAGTSVTISGTSFTGATAVAFNGASATFTVTSATAIQATVPAGATTGPVTVTTPGGTATSATAFTVMTPPTIASFSPSSGPVGTSVAISGTNFTGTTAVAFNGVSASFTVTSDSAIQTAVPAGASSGPLSVTTSQGSATSTGAFTVVRPPTITSFAPTSGPVGTSVTITGTNLGSASTVTFNGVNASFAVTSDTGIQATVPPGATTGPLTVTAPAGTATSTGSFTVVSPPAIAGFTPSSGAVGTSVTISGTDFTGATSVTFNGVSAAFTVGSATAINATVPPGASTGPISVTTPAGTATSTGSFTVMSPPAISGFAPASGPVGTSVTISGASFTGATAVAFNGVGATFTVTSDTAIQAIAPAGATSGALSVTTPAGTATSAGSFTVVSPPAISGLAPTSGPVGTIVTVSGTSFSGATSVAFNGAGATFTVVSATSIRATVPAGATTGPISVTTPGGTSTSSTSFTVTAALLVSKGGNGAGAVTSTSSPPNPVTAGEINCGASCSSTYAVGTVVTLTAAPAVGSNFTGWTGCDTVSGATCTVTMNAARSVGASFTLQTFPLTVKKASPLGIGDGTVTSTSNPGSPNQINCGSNCTVSFNYGTVVTLTASPALLSIFNGWTGCDSVSGTTCTVTIGAAKSVTANFLP